MSDIQRNSRDEKRSSLIICTLLVLLVSAVFLQVVGFDFINFDDPVYITENKHIQQGTTTEVLHWAFTTHLHGHFHPLTWLSHATDVFFFGLDPAGHHFINFLLHLINTILLFLVLKKMTGASWLSGFAAALFAIHPLHVESVAWVADRKDLLCGFFWILSLWVYTRFVEKNSYYYMFLLLLIFSLGLLSKTMMISLPLVLLLLDYWPLGRFGKAVSMSGKSDSVAKTLFRLIMEKAGLLVLAGIFILLTTGAIQDLRLESKTLSLYWQYDCFLFLQHYLEKFFWPGGLTVLYPYSETPAISAIATAALAGCVITILFIALRKRFPFLLTGWLWFIVTLLPVAGLIHDGPHRVADRYTYIPLIGLIFGSTWLGAELLLENKRLRRITTGAAGLLLLIFAIISYNQAGLWRSSRTVFQHNIDLFPYNWVGHNNLGDFFDKNGQKDQAIEQYLIALRIKPEFSKASYNLGNTYASLARHDEALQHYLHATKIYPDFVEAHNNAGVLLARKRHYLEAKRHFVSATAIDPDFLEAQKNLGDIMAIIGQLEDKILSMQRRVIAEPDNAELHSNLGLLFRQGGEVAKAQSHFQEALRINPTFAGGHNNLGILFAEQGDYPNALKHFQQAVDLAPNFTGAQANLERMKSLKGTLAPSPEG